MSAGLALAFWSVGRRSDREAIRRGFWWYGASFALTAVGTVGWFLMLAWFRLDPTYSWPNWPYLLSYPAAILGVLAFRAGYTSPALRFKLALDSAIALVAAVTITWLLVVAPIAVPTTRFEQFLTFAYPVGDLLVLVVLVPMLLTRREPNAARMLRWLAAGQLVYLVGDLASQLPPAHLLLAGSEWPDLVYLAGYVMMIAAVERASRLPPVDASWTAAPEQPSNPLPLLLGAILYALLVAAVVRSWSEPIGVLALAAVAVTGLILVREALTERVNLRLARELEARRSEARFQSAMGHLRVGVMVQDRDARIRLANPAAIEILGLERRGDEYLLTEDIVQDDGTPIARGGGPVALALATGAPVRNVVQGVALPGRTERTWVLVDVEPQRGADGRIDEVISSVHDITDRRALEDQLRQALRMEAVGRLAGGIAHDFNNLLTAIIGYSELVKGHLEAGSPLVNDVSEITAAARRAATLTQQLLAFSRRQLLRPELLDVNDVVHGAVRLLSRLLGEDIVVVTSLDPDAGAARVDRGQLEQVIINLAVNARDALPRGGRLEITTSRLEPTNRLIPSRMAVGASGAVLLRVADDGLGMDETTRARAFEPFFTTKEVGKGTGLGLSTVYGIVRQSGGEVWIDSAPGRGTAVSVCLPRVEGASPAKTVDPALGPTRGTETILIAEDEAAIRGVLRESLQRHGYRVLEVAEPGAARQLLGESDRTVDLLLCDVVMPGGSGPELAAWARARRPTLPVLFMTGYADEATLHLAGVAAADGPVVAKPFDPDQVAALIRRTLDGRR